MAPASDSCQVQAETESTSILDRSLAGSVSLTSSSRRIFEGSKLKIDDVTPFAHAGLLSGESGVVVKFGGGT